MIEIDKSHPSNLSDQLAASLRDAIRRGEYGPGQMLPSERELCTMVGLSRTTVRRAVESLVRQGIVQRVPGAGTFVGQAPSASSRPALGLIVPTLSNPYYGELSEFVEKQATSRGYDLLVGQSNYQADSEASYLQRHTENPLLKGVMVVPNLDALPMPAYRFMIERGVPFIFLARWPDEVHADAIAMDFRHAAYDAVRYLIGLGHRRIAFVKGTPRQPVTNLMGYRAALQEAGIAEDPDLIVVRPEIAEQAGLEAVRWLVGHNISFTAVFARNDVTAIGVLQGLAEAGLNVPKDVSVVGLDNIRASAHTQPPLTTIEHPVAEVARIGFWLLLDRIEGGYTGTPRRLLLQPKLVHRASCAPPPDGAGGLHAVDRPLAGISVPLSP